MKIASLFLVALLVINPRSMFRSPRETSARELVTNFAAGRLEAASRDFNETMRATATLAILAQLKLDIEAQVGSFRTVSEVRQGRDNGFPLIELICRYEKAPVSVRVSFDVNDRIAAVHMKPIGLSPLDPALEADARGLLANFLAGRFEIASERFNIEMRAQLTPTKLAELRDHVTQTFGAFRSITEVHQKEDEQFKAIELSTLFDYSPVLVRVVFDNQRRVAGLKIGGMQKH